MTRLPTRVLVAGVAFLTLVSSGVLAVPGQAAAQSLRQRELSPSGAWSWFGDPRAVFSYEGARRRTYVGWVTGSGSIQVASYDHDTRPA